MASVRHRNWILKTALFLLSVAVAALGAFGWADLARLYEALRLDDPIARLEALHPLWPLYATAAIGCVAAQVVAACATVNFARLAGAPPVWRGLAIAFYGVAVWFAAYSADIGAQAVIGAPHRAAYEARADERAELASEVTAIQGRLTAAQSALAAIDPATTYSSRQSEARATFEATTATDRERLPIVQAALTARPALPRERTPAAWEAAVFFVFLAWGLLEPWGYALAERGRTETPVRRRKAAPKAAPRRSWLRWGAAAFGLATLSAAPAAATPPTEATAAKATPPRAAPRKRVAPAQPAPLQLVPPAAAPRVTRPVTVEFVIETADRLETRGQTVSMRSLAVACDTSYALIARRLKAAGIKIDERWPKPFKRVA